jgi:hypothetical protein
MLAQTAVLENQNWHDWHNALSVTQEQAEPIRVIRKINGKYQFVTLASETEMTDNERRAAYVAMFLQ